MRNLHRAASRCRNTSPSGAGSVSKDQTIEKARIVNYTDIGGGDGEILLTEIEVTSKGAESRWLLPLAILWEDEPSAALPNRLALARVRRGRRLGLLTDAFALPTFAHCIVAALAAGRKFENPEGIAVFSTDRGRAANRSALAPRPRSIGSAAEQSNSSLTVGDTVMLKIFRRISAGEHPEAEMSRYLTAQGFANAPPLLGDIVRSCR